MKKFGIMAALSATIIFSQQAWAECSSECEAFKNQVITASDGTKFSVKQYNNVRLKQSEELKIYKKVLAEEPLSQEEQEAILLKRGRRELLYVGLNSYLGHGSTILGFLRYLGVDIGQDTINKLPFADSQALADNYYSNLYEVQNVPETKDIFGDIKGDLYSFIEQLLPYGVANLLGGEKIEYLGQHTEDMICNEDYLESVAITVLGAEKDSYGNYVNQNIDTSTAEFAQNLAQAKEVCAKLARNVLKRYEVVHDLEQENIALKYAGAARGASDPILNNDIVPVQTTYTADFRNVFTADLPEVKKFVEVALLDYEYAYCKLLAGLQGNYDDNGLDSFGTPLCQYGVDSYGMATATPSDINSSYQARVAMDYFTVAGVANFGNAITDVAENDIRNSDLSSSFGFDFTENFFLNVADDLSASEKDTLASVVNSASGDQVALVGSSIDDNVYMRINASPEGRRTFAISHERTGGTIYNDKFELGVDFLEFNFPPYKLRESDLFVLDFPINELDSAFRLSAVNGGNIVAWKDGDSSGDYTLAERLGEVNLSSLDIDFVTNHSDVQALDPASRTASALNLTEVVLSTFSGDAYMDSIPYDIAQAAGLVDQGIGNAYGNATFGNSAATSFLIDDARCGGSDAYVSNAATGMAPSSMSVSYDFDIEDINGALLGNALASADVYGANDKVYRIENSTAYGTLDPNDDRCMTGYTTSFSNTIGAQVQAALAP